MGELSKAIFGRRKLPPRCILYGGAYVPARKDTVRTMFDKWPRIDGTWVKFTFAESRSEEYLVVFNVYGGPIVLKLLQLLKDGGCTRAFFIGSMYAKDLPIGRLVIPVQVVDMAGPPTIDDSRKDLTELDSEIRSAIKKALAKKGLAYEEHKIVSVPAVLHRIDHVNKLVAEGKDIAGVEMETSTFIHFSSKLGLKGYPLLHVSDNEKHGLISKARTVWEARKRALQTSTDVALEVPDGP